MKRSYRAPSRAVNRKPAGVSGTRLEDDLHLHEQHVPAGMKAAEEN